MRNLKNMFNPPYPRDKKTEVLNLVDELIKIGTVEDFLSEQPGGAFNRHCRHKRAREIGEYLNEIGGFELMEYVFERVRKKVGNTISDHLEFAWSAIGQWMA